MSPGATRLRPAQEVSNETWIADATNGLLSMPSPLSFRERSLDAFKNGLMLIRLCGCGTVFTNLGSMLKRLFDRACQKDLAIWMVQRNLLSECEPAGVRIVAASTTSTSKSAALSAAFASSAFATSNTVKPQSRRYSARA